jgi:hypothetical protein
MIGSVLVKVVQSLVRHVLPLAIAMPAAVNTANLAVAVKFLVATRQEPRKVTEPVLNAAVAAIAMVAINVINSNWL